MKTAESEIKAFVQNWIDGHETDTFIKSNIKNEGYWYTSKNGVSSINLTYYFETLLEDFIEEQSEKKWSDDQMIQCYRKAINHSADVVLHDIKMISAEDYLQTLKQKA